MLRFIIFVLLLYLILRLVSFWRRISRSSSPPSSASPPTLSGRMVKDEVCQMYLPRENALREIIERCDRARYMDTPPREAMSDSLDDASEILKQLDKVLR